MKKSTLNSIRLGIFVIIAMLIFTTGVYMIGQKQSLFSETFTLRAQFSNVNGLMPGNNVRFSGINVGSVKTVTLLSDSLIEITMRIRENVRQYIKQNALVSIGTDGLMGNKIVNISPGIGSSEPVYDNFLLQSYSRIKTDDILNTLNVTNDNAAMLTHNLLEITEQIKKGQGTVSLLLYDTGLRENVSLTLKNLRGSAEAMQSLLLQLNQIAKQIDEGRGTIGWLLNDTLTENQVRTALEKLENAGDHLKSVSDSVKVILDKIKEGDGTLPVILNDTSMANDLRQTIHNLNDGTASFNENMEALKHNFLLRKYFKEQEKKTKKNKE